MFTTLTALEREVPDNHLLTSGNIHEYDIFICVSPHRKNFAGFTSVRLQINIPGFT